MMPTAKNIAAFAGALALGCVVIAAARPVPAWLEYEAKEFAASDTEVLFIGSSYTGMGIDAEALRERGIKACVVGIPAMGGRELTFVLDHLLGSRPASLRQVWIEARPWSPDTAKTQGHTYWHPRSTDAAPDFYRPRRGHDRDFECQLEWIPDARPVPWAMLHKARKRAEREGLRAVLYLPPSLRETHPHHPQAIDFNRPELYPKLFTCDVRWNHNHLNAEGAKLWSAEIARLIKADTVLTAAE